MSINLDPDSFITFANRKLNQYGRPYNGTDENGARYELDAFTEEYSVDLETMITGQFGAKDIDDPEQKRRLDEAFENLQSLGRIASRGMVTVDRHAFTAFTLVTEGIDSMPKGNYESPEVRKMGWVCIQSDLYHGAHPDPNIENSRKLASGLIVNAHILTDGSLYANAVIERCDKCAVVDTREEVGLLRSLGFADIYDNGAELDDFRNYRGFFGSISGVILDPDQQAGIKAHIDERFPTKE